MLYIFGIILAFIFGILIGRGWERSKQDDFNPFDVKMEEEDIMPNAPKSTPEMKIEASVDGVNWQEVSIFYPDKGNRLWS